MRTFDELNASMSHITGVPITNRPGWRQTFATVKQQLPPSRTSSAFLASHQTGVAQLAIQYCAALVDDAAARTAFFPALNISVAVAVERVRPIATPSSIRCWRSVIGTNLRLATRCS